MPWAQAPSATCCARTFAQPDGTYWIVVNTLRYPDPDEPDANGATHQHAGSGPSSLAIPWRPGRREGVDAANLQASIDAYNAVVEGGTDEFGFVADNTADAAMTEGFWYACRKVSPCTTPWAASAHVESEACNADGEPIRLVRRRRVHWRHHYENCRAATPSPTA
ncbi:MAG: hypothetical protein ACLTEX_03275 [Eggerthella lenta]